MSANFVINNTQSHKHFYEQLLHTKINTAKNILIMGSQTSFKFNDYFKNAHVDYINVLNRVPDHLINDHTTIYDINDKKNIETLTNAIFDKNIKYDIILDDGIHTKNTIDFYMSNYTDWLTSDGIIIIEDVWEWIELLKTLTPNHLKQHIEIYNILDFKNKLDDAIFVINKMSNQVTTL